MASRNDYSKFNYMPERQSKIDSIMKQEEHGLEEQLYCICRSSDISRFMIGCDRCEEWYHGDCIDIGEEESKYIKKFYCPPCRKRDPTLEIRYKQSKLDKVAGAKERDKLKRLEKEDDKSKRVREKEREREKLRERERMKDKERHKEKEKQREKDREKEEARKAAAMKREEPTPVVRDASYSDDDVWEPPEKQGKTLKPIRKKEASMSKEHRRRKRESEEEEESRLEDGPNQCYGPGCTKPPRQKSKYCSDNCGLNLATARIYQILPTRIQEWNMTSCSAEDKNKKSLEQIRRQQMAAKAALEDLDRKHKELDLLTSRARTAYPVDDDDDDMDGEGDAAATYCITCGLEIPVRSALRHMEKCFNKYESQTSFGSVYKTHIEGNNMFCDFFNPTTRMFCKRLRVLCPEHCKEAKISENEVCGCPLLKNVLEPTNEFCRVAKKKCVRHLGWEKLRRAEIDMERVRQWLKIDDLFEKERQVRQAMASRAGVLSLMLHSTYNHTMMDPQPEPEKPEKTEKTEKPEKLGKPEKPEKVQAAVPHADHDYF